MVTDLLPPSHDLVKRADECERKSWGAFIARVKLVADQSAAGLLRRLLDRLNRLPSLPAAQRSSPPTS